MRRWTDIELNYISKNAKFLSDKVIVAKLFELTGSIRSEKSVQRARRLKLGILKEKLTGVIISRRKPRKRKRKKRKYPGNRARKNLVFKEELYKPETSKVLRFPVKKPVTDGPVEAST